MCLIVVRYTVAATYYRDAPTPFSDMWCRINSVNLPIREMSRLYVLPKLAAKFGGESPSWMPIRPFLPKPRFTSINSTGTFFSASHSLNRNGAAP